MLSIGAIFVVLAELRIQYKQIKETLKESIEFADPTVFKRFEKEFTEFTELAELVEIRS